MLSAAPELHADGLRFVTADAPLRAWSDVAALDLGDLPPRVAWSPLAEDSAPWMFLGWGTAAEVVASGPDRLEKSRDEARRLFARIDGGSARADGPRPVLLGGFSFDPTSSLDRLDANDPPWRALGDTTFVLPHAIYAANGDRAFVATVVRRGHERAGEALLDHMRRALDAPRVARAPFPKRTRTADGAATFEANVARALDKIREGRLSKVVLARASRFDLAAPLAPSALLAALAPSASHVARYFLSREHVCFLGASPERLVDLRGRTLRTVALAGSAARRAPGRDADVIRALLASDKDLREHACVSDEIRREIQPFCSFVDAPSSPQVRSLSHVHHLITPFLATTARREHVLDIVARLHPTPALCGTPRDAAFDFIRAHEPAARGAYAGAFGWIDADGDGSFCVAIRGALIARTAMWIFAGAGIVDGSDPRAEREETFVKERAVEAMLGFSDSASPPAIHGGASS